MRAALRARANRLFVKYPRLGQLGYDLLRVTGLDRSTRGTKAFLRKLARQGFAPQTILDVGANYGGWSRVARAVFPAARFVLIEPQAEMRPFLDNFCAQTPGSRWLPAGAGAQPGELPLTVWDDLQGSAFLTPEVQALTPYREQRTVPVVAIGDLVSRGEIPLPDLIKIDVQGYALEVLRGSIACFGRTEVIIVETSLFDALGGRPNFYTITALLEAYGYRVYDLTDRKYRPSDGALGQVDVCFVRAAGRLHRARGWNR